jgi:hypothetical protein
MFMRDHVRCWSIPRLTAIATVAAAVIGLSGAVSSEAQAGALRQPGPRAATHIVARANPFTTQAMRTYLRSRRGDITAALYDVESHTLYLYRPGVTEQTASIVKVDILETLLHVEQRVYRPLDGDDEYLATGMIEESDNDDATDLWNEVGGPAAIARYDSLAGLTDTTPNAAGYWGETMTTALDQVRLVEHLVFSNKLLDAVSRAYELGLMEHVIPFDRWGVCVGPPAGVTVALKNGWVPIVDDDWQINSIGYVNGRGRDYVVAILTNGNLTEGYGITTIEGMSRLIWSRLAPKPKR